MTELTEASLEKVLADIAKQIDDPEKRITLKPTQLFVRPSDLAALGYTVDYVVKMLKKNHE